MTNYLVLKVLAWQELAFPNTDKVWDQLNFICLFVAVHEFLVFQLFAEDK